MLVRMVEKCGWDLTLWFLSLFGSLMSELIDWIKRCGSPDIFYQFSEQLA